MAVAFLIPYPFLSLGPVLDNVLLSFKTSLSFIFKLRNKLYKYKDLVQLLVKSQLLKRLFMPNLSFCLLCTSLKHVHVLLLKFFLFILLWKAGLAAFLAVLWFQVLVGGGRIVLVSYFTARITPPFFPRAY
jgi:hypothetical protein